MASKYLRLIGLAAALSLNSIAPAARAAELLVDTGIPTGNRLSGLFGFTGQFIQHLAGIVTFDATVEIQSVAIWGRGAAAASGGPGLMRASLYAAGPVPGGTALFTSDAQALFSREETWLTIGGLSWVAGAGSYWLAFEPLPRSERGFDGGARNGAPFPLSGYAFSSELPFVGAWQRQDALGLGIQVSGVRIGDPSVIPEPTAWAMLIVGFGLVGSALRRRRTAVESIAAT